MKNLFKVFGIIALVAVIGFSFAACSMGDDDTTNNNNNNNETPEKTVTKVTTWGGRNSFRVGDTFTTDGDEEGFPEFNVRVYYSDNPDEGEGLTADQYTLSTPDMSTKGIKTVTVTHTASGTTGTYDIYVYPAQAVKADYIDEWVDDDNNTLTITADAITYIGSRSFTIDEEWDEVRPSHDSTISSYAADETVVYGTSNDTSHDHDNWQTWTRIVLTMVRGVDNDTLILVGANGLAGNKQTIRLTRKPE